MLIKCNWKTCKYYKDELCRAEAIELKSFDYEEDNEEFEGLKCSTYEYDPFWMCDKGRDIDVEKNKLVNYDSGISNNSMLLLEETPLNEVGQVRQATKP